MISDEKLTRESLCWSSEFYRYRQSIHEILSNTIMAEIHIRYVLNENGWKHYGWRCSHEKSFTFACCTLWSSFCRTRQTRVIPAQINPRNFCQKAWEIVGSAATNVNPLYRRYEGMMSKLYKSNQSGESSKSNKRTAERSRMLVRRSDFIYEKLPHSSMDGIQNPSAATTRSRLIQIPTNSRTPA